MNIRKNIEAQMESQRFQAAQVAREQSAQAAFANALETAANHFMAGRWADSRRVLELARAAR